MYILRMKLARSLHFRLDRIKVLFELVHVCLLCWPVDTKPFLLVRFGNLRVLEL